MQRKPPAEIQLATDLVIFTIESGALRVLVIDRGNEPYRGRQALPGGFLRGLESVEQTARRELAEETGLDDPALPLEQLGVYSDPGRDPRQPRVVSCAFLAILPNAPVPRGGSDAVTAGFVSVDSILAGGELAFDHDEILRDALASARAKLRYTTIATAFCGPEFTMSELHTVYQIIWGEQLDRPNFHRKVIDSEGFVVPTGRKRSTVGRPATLYRAGDATVLTRPLMGSLP